MVVLLFVVVRQKCLNDSKGGRTGLLLKSRSFNCKKNLLIGSIFLVCQKDCKEGKVDNS